MTTWQDLHGVTHELIRVFERADRIVWDTVCFYAVRVPVEHISLVTQPVTCLFCLNGSFLEEKPWSKQT